MSEADVTVSNKTNQTHTANYSSSKMSIRRMLNLLALRAAPQDATERGGQRLRRRARRRPVGQPGRLRVDRAARPGGRGRGGGAVAAHDPGGAGGRGGDARLEEGALLPGPALLAGLARHARHGRRHRDDEPAAGGDAPPLVAEDAVLPAAARLEPRGRGRGRRVKRRGW